MPLFFSDPFLEPLVPYPNQRLSCVPERLCDAGSLYRLGSVMDEIDDELTRAWDVMTRFCMLVNSTTEAGQKLPKEILFDTMASVMYRLLRMRFECSSTSEAIRLGLLAFSSHVFLQWHHFKVSQFHFPIRFQECLTQVDTLSPHVVLWLLMIGAICVFSQQDEVWLKPWLRTSIEVCDAKSWTRLHEYLESLMWIDIVYDKPGKDVFDSLFPASGSSPGEALRISQSGD